MLNPRLQKFSAAALLVAAGAMLVAGIAYKRRIYDQDDAFKEFGLLTFSRVTDIDLAEDATFTGVIRKEGKLYSTYDRMAPPRGKRACPT